MICKIGSKMRKFVNKTLEKCNIRKDVYLVHKFSEFRNGKVNITVSFYVI